MGMREQAANMSFTVCIRPNQLKNLDANQLKALMQGIALCLVAQKGKP